MSSRIRVVAVIIVLALVMISLALADVPQLISFQGKLSDSSGVPLTGNYDLTFSIYSQETEGTALWTETVTVNCDDGLYQVILGQTSSITLDFDGQYWLGVRIAGDDELSPRYRLATVPTAFRARVADQVSWTDLTDVPAGFADDSDDVGEAGGVSQINNGAGITVTNPTGPTATVAANIGSGADQVAAGDHTHSSLDAGDGDPASAVYVDNYGSVGIGTTSPNGNLHIKSTEHAQLRLDSGPGNQGMIHFYENGSGPRGSIKFRADAAPQYLLLETPGTSHIILEPTSGNVGIGTTAPGEKLSVSGTIHSLSGGFKFPDGSVQTTAAAGGVGDGYSLDAVDGTPTDALYVNEDGNVGIGTTNPQNKLEIVGGLTCISPDNEIDIGLSIVPYTHLMGLFLNDNSGGASMMYFSRTQTKNRIEIPDPGVIGIGVGNPEVRLDVKSSGFADGMRIRNHNNQTIFSVNENLDASGSVYVYNGSGSSTVRFSGAASSYINGGNLGIGTTSPGYKLDVAGPVNLNKGLTGIALTVNGDEAIWYNDTYFSWGFGGTANYFADKVGIGTTNPLYTLHVIGNIAYTGNLYDVSDIRLKENIAPLENALEKISSINSIYFNNTGEEQEKREVGVIAQEVEKVLPEAVSTNTDGYKAVDYSKLTPLLIEAVKEQQIQIEALKAMNEELREDINAMRKFLDR